MKGLLILVVIFIGFTAASTALAPQFASAATEEDCDASRPGSGSIPILPKWYKYIPHHFDGTDCVLQADTDGDGEADLDKVVPAVLLAVVEILLRIVGILAVIFVIYGGFQYLTSTGEPDKAKAGRTTIINALVGLMIAMLATAIVNLIGRNIV